MSDEQSKELQISVVDPSGIVSVDEIDNMNVTNLMKFCDEKYIQNVGLTAAEIKKLGHYLTMHGSGDFQSVPMVCSGPECCIGAQCPLASVGKAPISFLCPFERLFMEKWKEEYIKSLKADWSDKIERALVMELVEIDILNARANSYLATEGFIMENVVGIDEQTGKALMRKEEHIALSVKAKVQARRDKVLKSMVATREAKSKLFASMKDDASIYSAKLREKARVLNEAHDDANIMEVEIDAEGNNTDSSKDE